jgi:hypothetical protein
MAEVNELSLSNLEGVTTPSTSQENIPNTNELFLSNLEGVETSPISSDLNLSNLEGVKLTDTSPETTLKSTSISSIYTGDKIDRKFIVGGDEPTTTEKIAYGLDKQNMFFGNVFRVAKSGLEAAFDPDREFKQVAIENAANEKADLYNRHEKFRDGKYDDDIEVLASEMATFLVDPYYN